MDRDYVFATISEDILAGILTAVLSVLYLLFLTHVVALWPDWAITILGDSALVVWLWWAWRPYDEVGVVAAVIIALLRGCVTWLALAAIYCSVASYAFHLGNQPVSEATMTIGNILFFVSMAIAFLRVPADVSPKCRRKQRIRAA